LARTCRDGVRAAKKSTNMHIRLCPLTSGVSSGLRCSFDPSAQRHQREKGQNPMWPRCS
ncbi:uncharacterized, partial [Tachysurus ichikawai]